MGTALFLSSNNNELAEVSWDTLEWQRKKWYCVKKGLLRLPKNAKYAISYNLELNLLFKKCFRVNDLNS